MAESSTLIGDPTNGNVAYTYDSLSRLTGYARDGAPAQTYGWQPVPNRSTVQVGTDPALTTTFDNANRPTTDSAGGSYDSDDDGRLTGRPGQTLEWDSLGRLTEILAAPGGATLATYTYDTLDRLRLVDHGGSDRTRFRYVGLTTSVAQVVDDTSGSVLRSVGTSWSGELLMDWTGGGVSQRIYGTNGHHDLTWNAGPDGTVAGTTRYDPWGTVVGSSGAGLPDFGFQSSWHDSTTQVSWVVTRWYAPSLGRFVSEDSLLGTPSQPASRHLYVYGLGDPVEKADPSGDSSYSVSFQWAPIGGGYGQGSWRSDRVGIDLRAYAKSWTPIGAKSMYWSRIQSNAVRYTGPGNGVTLAGHLTARLSMSVNWSEDHFVLAGIIEEYTRTYIDLIEDGVRIVHSRRVEYDHRLCWGAALYLVYCDSGFGASKTVQYALTWQSLKIRWGHNYAIGVYADVQAYAAEVWADVRQSVGLFKNASLSW